MGLTIEYTGPTTAAPGEVMNLLVCKVTLTSPLPSWPEGINTALQACSFGLGWSDDTNGVNMDNEGVTTLAIVNHPSELLTLPPVNMPASGNFTKTAAIFRPSTDAEYAQGKYWVKVTPTLAITITPGSGGDDGGGDGTGTSFTCSVCSSVFSTQALLDAHVAAGHDDEPGFFSKYWKWIVGGGVVLAGLAAVGVAMKKRK
jgi:hypothetical protein